MYKEKIDAYIDSKKEEMLADLMTLVRIDSQRGTPKEGMPFGEGPASVLAAAEKMLAESGLQTTNYDNYVVTGDLSDKEKALDVLAHLDVVPVTADWTVTQPFEPKIVGDRIYGRGTADDKGPAIAALYALRAIREVGVPMKKSVRLILGSDEECGSGDLRYYYSKEQEAPYSFTPDADFPLINIEKGGLKGNFHASFTDGEQLPGVLFMKSGDKANIVPQRARLILAGLSAEEVQKVAGELGEKLGVTFTVSSDVQPADEAEAERVGQLQRRGVAVVGIDVRGKAAHASTPQEGKNALTAAIRLTTLLPLADSQAVRALRGLDELLPFEDTCGKNLGIYREDRESGAVTVCFSILSVDEQGLKGTFDSRLPIGCDEVNTQKPAAEALARKQITMDLEPMVHPHCVPGDSAFVKTLLGSYERYTGIHGAPLSTGGGTYVHNLKRGVAFGCMTPDVDNHMHGDDEFMVIERLMTSAKIFADAMIKVCNEL
jgi:succinyl-diaminopimelate desuccinylase